MWQKGALEREIERRSFERGGRIAHLHAFCALNAPFHLMLPCAKLGLPLFNAWLAHDVL